MIHHSIRVPRFIDHSITGSPRSDQIWAYLPLYARSWSCPSLNCHQTEFLSAMSHQSSDYPRYGTFVKFQQKRHVGIIPRWIISHIWTIYISHGWSFTLPHQSKAYPFKKIKRPGENYRNNCYKATCLQIWVTHRPKITCPPLEWGFLSKDVRSEVPPWVRLTQN